LAIGYASVREGLIMRIADFSIRSHTNSRSSRRLNFVESSADFAVQDLTFWLS
jgi:hypothetical protein